MSKSKSVPVYGNGPRRKKVVSEHQFLQEAYSEEDGYFRYQIWIPEEDVAEGRTHMRDNFVDKVIAGGEWFEEVDSRVLNIDVDRQGLLYEFTGEIGAWEKAYKTEGFHDVVPSGQVIRFVITAMDEASRTMVYPHRGEKTYEKYADAEAALKLLVANNSQDDLKHLAFGDPGTLAVRATPCYAGHFDPAGTVFVL